VHTPGRLRVSQCEVTRGVFPAGRRRFVALGLPVLLATGCNSNQAITNPATRPARDINTLWWAMLAGAMVVFGAVVALLVIAYIRRGRAGSRPTTTAGPTR